MGRRATLIEPERLKDFGEEELLNGDVVVHKIKVVEAPEIKLMDPPKTRQVSEFRIVPRPPAQYLRFEDISAAAFRIQSGIQKTPCTYSRLSKLYGMEIYLKKEHLHYTGSVKERGVLYLLTCLTQEQQTKGVIVATDCNFSMAVAHHAAVMKVPVFVIMPSGCSSPCLRIYRDYGAMVISYGSTSRDSQNHARLLASENGYLYLEEDESAEYLAGLGTVGMEIYEQVPKVDAVIVPAAGQYGLLAGTAAAIKHLNSQILVMGMWIGLLHHVTGEHEWSLDACQHDPLLSDREKDWIQKGSTPHKALSDIILSERWLKEIPKYLKFRSTANLEAFHNHLLMYASKRFSYIPPVYEARILLAALDYNQHLHREVKRRADGSIQWIYEDFFKRVSEEQERDQVVDAEEICMVKGVEPEGFPLLLQSLKTDSPVPNVHSSPEQKLYEGLMERSLGVNTFQLAKKLVDKVLSVSEDHSLVAMLRFQEFERSTVDAEGAMGLAAILAGNLPELRGKKVVVVVSSANMAPELMRRCVDRALVLDDRVSKFSVQLGEWPGDMARLLDVLSREDVRLLDVCHRRHSDKSDLFKAKVECVVETRDKTQSTQLRKTLNERYPSICWLDR